MVGGLRLRCGWAGGGGVVGWRVQGGARICDITVTSGGDVFPVLW